MATGCSRYRFGRANCIKSGFAGGSFCTTNSTSSATDGQQFCFDRDQGKTWTRRGGVAFLETDFDEHMIVELRDGRLWMLARTKKGISESFSTDQGVMWSEPRPSTIQNLSARFFIRRLASGNLLLVKNGPGRSATAASLESQAPSLLSEDDGGTLRARVCCSMIARSSRIPTDFRVLTGRSTSSTTGTATPTPRSCWQSSARRTCLPGNFESPMAPSAKMLDQ